MVTKLELKIFWAENKAAFPWVVCIFTLVFGGAYLVIMDRPSGDVQVTYAKLEVTGISDSMTGPSDISVLLGTCDGARLIHTLDSDSDTINSSLVRVEYFKRRVTGGASISQVSPLSAGYSEIEWVELCDEMKGKKIY